MPMILFSQWGKSGDGGSQWLLCQGWRDWGNYIYACIWQMSWIMVSELFHRSPWILASIFLVFFHSYIWWMSLYIFIVVLGSSNTGQLENSLHTLLIWAYLGKADFPPILEGHLVGSAQSRDSSRNIQPPWSSKLVRINQLSYLFKPGWVSGPHPEAFIS